MQYLPIVEVLERKAYLHQPVEHVVLGERHALSLEAVEPVVQVASLAIIHDNAQRRAAHERSMAAYDVGMVQRAEHFGLLLRLGALLGAQAR